MESVQWGCGQHIRSTDICGALALSVRALPLSTGQLPDFARIITPRQAPHNRGQTGAEGALTTTEATRENDSARPPTAIQNRSKTIASLEDAAGKIDDPTAALNAEESMQARIANLERQLAAANKRNEALKAENKALFEHRERLYANLEKISTDTVNEVTRIIADTPPD